MRTSLKKALRKMGQRQIRDGYVGDGLSSERLYFHQRLNERIALRQEIAAKNEDGCVYLVESGMDCDCVQFVSSPVRIPANWRMVEERIDHANEWADGPLSVSILSASEARQVEPRSIDLALEAFENGHPHVVYPH